ncbi:hypothetical protein MnTg02_01216 [bacterium MnTg02]|nr:hypothetical protein MnTg02_01216 [bacterium MnTg02]
MRPALYLKDAERVRLAQHVVDGRVLARHAGKRQLAAVMRVQKIEAFMDAGEHSKSQNIHFQEAQSAEVVLVPFDDGAVLHGGIADGHDFIERSPRQNEAPHMLGEMARKPHQFSSEA